MKVNKESMSLVFTLMAPTLIVVVLFAAWLTHVVTCITSAAWGFLIAGAIFFPIGTIHGFMIWLGMV